MSNEIQNPLTTTTATKSTTIDEDKSLTLNDDINVDVVDRDEDDPESNASSLISDEYNQPFSVTTLDSDDFDSLDTTTSITIPIPAVNGNESQMCNNNTSNNYGNPLAYSLHTIIEESCEESDADDYYAAKHLRQIKVNANNNNNNSNNNLNNNDSHTRSNHNTYGNNDDDEFHGQHNHNGHYGDEIYDGDAVFIQQYHDVGDNDDDDGEREEEEEDDDNQIEGDYDDDDDYFNDNQNGHHSPFHTSDSESLPTDLEQFNNYQIAHHVINQMGSIVDSESSVSSGHDDDYDDHDIGNGPDKEPGFSPSSRLEKYFTIGLVSPDAYDYSGNVDLQVKEKKKDVVIKEKKNISTTSIDVEGEMMINFLFHSFDIFFFIIHHHLFFTLFFSFPSIIQSDYIICFYR